MYGGGTVSSDFIACRGLVNYPDSPDTFFLRYISVAQPLALNSQPFCRIFDHGNTTFLNQEFDYLIY